MINDPDFFAESLLVPHTYKEIFKKIHSHLSTSNYSVMCNTYKSKLGNSFQNDVPIFREFADYSNSDFLQNTIFLKQAQNFVNLGKTSGIAVKPLLLYYAEKQLFAFFMNSLFHFNNSSQGHGLKMIGDNYQNIGIEFKKSGFFQRIINTYTILQCAWVFSPFERTAGDGFSKLNSKFDFTTTPNITLAKLIEIKDGVKPAPHGYIFDQVDFLFLFLAFSLSQYNPALWHSIVNGEYGNEITYFKQVFTRFEKLSKRLTDTLFSLYNGQTVADLYSPG